MMGEKKCIYNINDQDDREICGFVPVDGNCRHNASHLCFHSCHVKTVGGVQNVMRLDNPALAPHQPPGLLS